MRQLQDALRAQASKSATPLSQSRSLNAAAPPRLCLGLFAAADALGFGFVHGVPPLMYLERLEPRILEALGLSPEVSGDSPDVYVGVPAVQESAFRGVVHRDGVPVSDIIQIWLDASAYPTRGTEQAGLIHRRVLRPLLDGRRR